MTPFLYLKVALFVLLIIFTGSNMRNCGPATGYHQSATVHILKQHAPTIISPEGLYLTNGSINTVNIEMGGLGVGC